MRGILAVALFVFDDYYLPPQIAARKRCAAPSKAGRRKRSCIQRKNGCSASGSGGACTYLLLPILRRDDDAFANLSVFEFNPSTFALSRRIFASRVIWDEKAESWRFHNGWVRNIDGNNSSIVDFRNTSFSEIDEDPGYFKKENLQSQEMNFQQLDAYIRDLRQSGFDTMRLRVALWHKLAYPLVAVIMAVLAIPFALSMGRRGSLTGIAVAISVALAYWVVDALFGAMGMSIICLLRWRHGRLTYYSALPEGTCCFERLPEKTSAGSPVLNATLTMGTCFATLARCSATCAAIAGDTSGVPLRA